MLFSKQLPLGDLVLLCRALRHNLGAGLTLRDVFRQQSERGPVQLRPIARRIAATLEQGDSLDKALKREADSFPPLFLALAGVGEETGHLPEIFGELESYFTLQQKLSRQFRSQSIVPIAQLCLAFLVLALLIFILGMIAESRNTTPPGVFGLRGGRGAIAFLALSFGTIALVYVGYLFVARRLGQKPALDALWLRVPGVGPCLEAFALARFSVAMQLTLDSGMAITQALRLSLQATGNGTYLAAAPAIVQSLKAGKDLTASLVRGHVLPREFLDMVAVAEEGGRVPEMMRHQASHYHEESQRRLRALTRMASAAVWLIYAVFMIVAIFSIARIYLGALGA